MEICKIRGSLIVIQVIAEIILHFSSRLVFMGTESEMKVLSPFSLPLHSLHADTRRVAKRGETGQGEALLKAERGAGYGIYSLE